MTLLMRNRVVNKSQLEPPGTALATFAVGVSAAYRSKRGRGARRVADSKRGGIAAYVTAEDLYSAPIVVVMHTKFVAPSGKLGHLHAPRLEPAGNARTAVRISSSLGNLPMSAMPSAASTWIQRTSPW